MRLAIPLIAPALLFSAAPAFASRSIDCGTTDGSNIDLAINTEGDGRADRARGATLTLPGNVLATEDTPPGLRIGRSTLGRRDIHVELLAGRGVRVIAVLQIRVNLNDASTGTLTVNGRRHPVSCEFG